MLPSISHLCSENLRDSLGQCDPGVLSHLGSPVDRYDFIYRLPILSFGVWAVALLGLDVINNKFGLSKKKEIIALVIFVLAFLAWFEGTAVHDKSQRRAASQGVVEQLQDDGLLPKGDYSAYYSLYGDD